MNKKLPSEIKIANIHTFFKKRVTKFGTSAKIGCSKEYLGKEVYVIVLKD